MSQIPNVLGTHFGSFLRRFCLFWMVILIVFPVLGQKDKRDSIAYRIQRLESANQFNPKDSTHIDLLVKLSKQYHFINNDSLFQISNRVLKISKAIGYKLGEIEALINIGLYYSDQGEYEKALSYLNKSLQLAREIKNTELELRIINDSGREYDYMGNYAEALNLYLKGLDIAQKTDNKLMLSILNENIASLYTSQKDFKNALVFYDKVQCLNEELGNEIFHAETQSNMASLYRETQNFQLAMFYINKSIATFEKYKIYDWLAYSYGVKGSVYLEQKKYTWALYWYDQSNMLHQQQLQDDREKINLLNGMAKVYLGLDRDSLSLVSVNEGYSISKKIKSLQGQIDCAETLYQIHKKRNESDIALSYLEIFKQLSDSLSKDKNKQSLALLETKLQYQQEKQELIASNHTALAKQRNYIYFSVLMVLILLTILFLIRRSEKVQKKLNRELKEKSKEVSHRENQLTEINKTKTKLFSIIGHDLRGPIGALQGMLKLFSDGEISKTEFLSFIPKLKCDVENISFALNNLLSWGQTQLNGVVTKPKRIQFEKLVFGNIKLLSEIAAGKSIKIINRLPENMLVWADYNQIDIVVRNLLSNAIKFTPDDGLITIEAKEDANLWQIMIRDTGIGMNKEIQKKIFADTNTITTYGTNNEKGTGLGLSLCREMVNKNRGQIWVESTLRKGSTFYFTIPKAEKRYQQAS